MRIDPTQQIHLIGIGGAGMQGIAEVLLAKGYRVSGSDLHEHSCFAKLKSAGAQVFVGHDAEHVQAAKVVAYSSAIPDNNVELEAARKLQLPVLQRAELLAALTEGHEVVSIAGTHGKTTTSAIVSHVLHEAGQSPSYVIGEQMVANDSRAQLGQGPSFVIEADESDRSFLHYRPTIAVVTNIHCDHMASYGHSPQKLFEAFQSFVAGVAPNGSLVLCTDDPQVCLLTENLAQDILSYGLESNARIHASSVAVKDGRQTFMLHNHLGQCQQIDMSLIGKHQVLNVLAAYGVCHVCGVSLSDFSQAIASFSGVKRRFERLMRSASLMAQDLLVVDDYGHHPNEISATIASARMAWPDRRLVMCFQPHRYSRTRDLFDEFLSALTQVDSLVLMPIYAAHEAPLPGITSLALCQALLEQANSSLDVVAVERLDQVLPTIQAATAPGDVVIFQGAGDITHVAHTFAAHQCSQVEHSDL